jgi:hypothetical protein
MLFAFLTRRLPEEEVQHMKCQENEELDQMFHTHADAVQTHTVKTDVTSLQERGA